MSINPEHCQCGGQECECEKLRAECECLKAEGHNREERNVERTSKLMLENVEMSVRITALEFALSELHQSYDHQPHHEDEATEMANRWAQLTLADDR